MTGTDSATRWVWRGSALGALAIGWSFILFHNNFHLTPAVVFIMLGFLAGVATIYNLFRVGAAAVTPVADDEAAWAPAAGARDELEREKRTLLKAIKEAEFDHQMGKLSQADLDQMVRQYRLRAIEVIKLLERGKGGTVREQIELEVRARLEVQAVRDKVERAHAEALRKHRGKQAVLDAAQATARAAAAAGASGAVVARLAEDAARRAAIAAEEEERKAKGAAQADPAPETAKAGGADAGTSGAGDSAKADEAAQADEAAKTDEAAQADAAAKSAQADEAAQADDAAKADDAVKAEEAAKSDDAVKPDAAAKPDAPATADAASADPPAQLDSTPKAGKSGKAGKGGKAGKRGKAAKARAGKPVKAADEPAQAADADAADDTGAPPTAKEASS